MGNRNTGHEVRVKMTGIKKAFGGISALNGVDFELRKGEIHALMGENGAGKSTLMRVMSGVYQADEGYIEINGKEQVMRSPKDGIAGGISVIWQEFSLMPDLSVAENILIDDLSHGKKVIDWKAFYRKARRILDDLGYPNISEKARVSELSTSQQQVVEICKALSRRSDVLVLDEPTALLAAQEVRKLFGIIRRLRDEGNSIVYISHRLEEIFELSDRITVLKDGGLTGTVATKETDEEKLMLMMVGRKPSELFEPRQARIGEVSIKAEDLCRGRKVDHVSFQARSGEVLGLYGLVGAGRTEIIRLLFGADKKESGTVYVHGKKVRINSPRDALKYRIGLLPEDRKHQGVLLNMAIRVTSTLSCLKNYTGLFGKIALRKEAEKVTEVCAQLNLKYRDIDQDISELSGGNQQKVALSKLLNSECEILLLDEPTRGVDVGAKVEIYRMINRLAESGKTLIVVSSEMMELIGLCDRVIVIHEGTVAAELGKNDISEQNLIRYSMGVEE